MSEAKAPPPNQRLIIGEIVAAHGLAGDVRVQPLTDFPERFHELGEVWVAPKSGEPTRRRITRTKRHETKGLLILQFAGAGTREHADKLVGAFIEIEADKAKDLPEGTYFEHDIVGLRVITPDGQDLGRITEILHTGANDVYVTRRCLIPAIEDVVKEVDLAAGKMVIEAIPGLLEE